MELQDLTRHFRERDLFARHLGIELESMEPGYARASLELGPEHANGLGIAHGGALFSLADLAFAAASNSHGTAAVAINAGISYVKAVSQGRVRAEAKEISCGSRLATYTVEVRDEEDAICAVFQGTVYRKGRPLFEPEQTASHEP